MAGESRTASMWWVRSRTEVLGPLTYNEVNRAIRSGEFETFWESRRGNDAHWKPLRQQTVFQSACDAVCPADPEPEATPDASEPSVPVAETSAGADQNSSNNDDEVLTGVFVAAGAVGAAWWASGTAVPWLTSLAYVGWLFTGILVLVALALALVAAFGLFVGALDGKDPLDESKRLKDEARIGWGIGSAGVLFAALLIAWPLTFGGGSDPAVAAAEEFPLHPVFNTPVSGASSRRPAIRLFIINDSEIFGRAELYLSVHSSRFPGDTRVLLPVNVGDFQGCRQRFIQLPFEAYPGDEIIFELLDDDSLTEQEAWALVGASRLAGYCVLRAGSAYVPVLAKLPGGVGSEAGGMLGEAYVHNVNGAKFENFGTSLYVVPPALPDVPRDANPLTILDGSGSGRVQLRIYAPPQALDASRHSVTHAAAHGTDIVCASTSD